jgi:hypothetical protein
MKKYFFIIFSIFNAYAMEPEVTPCVFKNISEEIKDLIASFLTFDDIESEEEFIQRKKTTSQYDPKPLFDPEKRKDKKIESPILWLKEQKNIVDVGDIYLVVYSPNNAICAMTYGDPSGYAIYYLSIVDTKTRKELHNVCLRDNDPEKYYNHLAVSSCGNIFAACYSNNKNGLYHQSYTKITNLRTKTKERPNYFLPSVYENDYIAFHKQGTHLIMQSLKYDPNSDTHTPKHTLIPLTTTLDTINTSTQKKTLKHYFEQKMICKNIQ